MRDLLIRNGNLLVSASHETLKRADILVRDGLIAEIGPNLTGDCEILDLDGDLVIPGLINAHVHSSGNFMRGTLEALPLEIFMLYEVPPLADGPEEPETVGLRTMIGAAEMLRLGITSVMDDAFFVPLTSTSSIDAIAGAYEKIGIRATLALDQPLVVEYEKYPFLRDILPEVMRRTMDEAPRETEKGMLSHYDHLISRWHGAGDGRLAAAVSCSAPQRAHEGYLRSLHELSRRHDIPYFCHVLETKLQRVLGEEKYGMSLVKYIDQLGILDERMQVIHSIWVDDDDIGILAKSGAVVAHNPVCNLRLGSGIMPFRALKDAGVPICLGTDEAVSDDSHNLWNAMKTASIMHTMCGGDYETWPRCAEILAAVWDGGNQVMRRPSAVGRIEVGASADLAVLDRNAPGFQPLHDIRRALVLCEGGGSVRHTIVDGRVVVRDRQLTTIDERAMIKKLREIEPQLRAQAVALQAGAKTLEPYYRSMVKKAAARDVGFSRWMVR